ncbi:MAG: tetratricopeptide repeat protein [Lachnospiraceae bacterium]|nr:tetratricopeptide repeat protein [Lachnospiraceae bacterium]
MRFLNRNVRKPNKEVISSKRAFWQPVIFALLLGVFSLTACTSKEDAEAVQKGYEFLEEPDYTSAEQSFRQAIDSKSDLAMAYRGLGICLMNKGEYEEAIDAFKEALANSGATPSKMDYDVNYYMGVCFHKLGQYKEAKERYDAIIALKSREVDAYMQRGAEYLYLKDVDSACTDFDKALSLKKKDFTLYIDIYNLLAETGYQSYGADYLNEALQKYNRNMSDYDKGYINYCLGNYPTAKDYLEQARTGGNKSEEVLLLLGKCYEELDDTAFAITIYSKYLETEPDAGVYNQLAVALIDQGRYEEALDAVVNGLELDANECRQELLYNRIVAYEHLAQFDKARDLCAQYLVDYPSDEDMAREYNFLKTR